MTHAVLDSSEIDRRFAVAVSWVQNKNITFPIKPSASQSLFFYGRYKQATTGDNTAPKPSVFTPIRRYMWSAHEKNKGISSTQAKEEYVTEIQKLCEAFDLSTLSPELTEAAEKFFRQFYNTNNHPFRGKMPASSQNDEPISAEPVVSSSGRSPSAPTSPSPELDITPPTSASPLESPRSNGRTSASPAVASPNGTRSAIPAAVASPNGRAAALTAEVRDKELLASKLLALQASNASKLAQLERQMAAVNHGRPPAPVPSSHFATPINVRSRAALTTPTPARNGIPFTTLDPSSPFTAAWTPTGLESRPPAATSVYPTPSTPFVQSWHTPNPLHPSPPPADRTIRPNGITHDVSALARSVSPRRVGREVATSNLDVGTSTNGSAVVVAPVLANGGGTSLDVDSLLADLDRKHQAQVAVFQAAERDWQSQMALADARYADLAARLAAAESGVQPQRNSSSSSSAPACELTISVAEGSLVHRLAQVAQVAVPIGVVAAVAYGIWRRYERIARH